MSISSLANAAAARRADFAPVGSVPQTLSEIASAATSPPSATPAASDGPPTVGPGGLAGDASAQALSLSGLLSASATPPTLPPEQKSSGVNTALNLLFGYIPTEVLTLYVAVLASTQQKGSITWAGWAAFWCFLVATPVVVWLIFGAKIKAAQKPIPVHPRAWPVWEMFAATVAFCAWAFAMPNAPFTGYVWYSSALAGVSVLVASTLLGLLAPLFQRPLSA